MNKTGSGVEALVGVRVELEAGRAPDDDALAVAPVDAAGLGAPGVEARAVTLAPLLETRMAVDFAFAFAFDFAFAFAFAREAAAFSLRALPNFHCLARTAIATFFASTASAPPKFLVRGPDARPDQQSAAVFAARFLAVSARKRKVFLPTSGASILANDATN